MRVPRTSAVGLVILVACQAETGVPGLSLDSDDIGGVVSSSNGPEAGVWVIAETDDLDTRFARIVVTDDAGRYVVPDLPEADYELWVRGYGLVDSEKVSATPGDVRDLCGELARRDA
ncbi:MAG: carboxypeptidase-like regulatory domain-containing protein, partial [Acidobacteriota bacterium]|nr:carboxypeptidase-like regulatory domain-containing protein [Acidobacteriota bacterium]